MSGETVIVSTGTANTASVTAGLNRVGVHPGRAVSAEQIEQAQRVVVPGVGTFGSALGEIDRLGLRQSLVQRIEAGRATLMICAGLQLLFEKSEESPRANGLGILPGTVERFDGRMIVPHMGWSQIDPEPGCRLVDPGWGYFANSYRVPGPGYGWSVATAIHGAPFIAAIEREEVLGCQFHPELSGAWGRTLLQAWVAATERGS